MGLIVGEAEREKRDDDADESEISDIEEDRLERELDSMYELYQEKKSDVDAKFRAKKARKEHDDGEWEGLSNQEESSEDDIIYDEGSEGSSEVDDDTPGGSLSTLQRTQAPNSIGLTSRAALFFDQDIFKNIDGLDKNLDDDSAIEMEGFTSDDVSKDADRIVKSSDDASSSEQPPYNGTAKATPKKKQSSPECSIRPTGPMLESDKEPGFEIVKRTGDDAAWQDQGEPHKNGRLGELYLSLTLSSCVM
jgi:AdoMet-dependent rRNA methyltransferase SPB1